MCLLPCKPRVQCLPEYGSLGSKKECDLLQSIPRVQGLPEYGSLGSRKECTYSNVYLEYKVYLNMVL